MKSSWQKMDKGLLLIMIILSIVGFLYTNYIKNAPVQSPEEVETIITDSIQGECEYSLC